MTDVQVGLAKSLMALLCLTTGGLSAGCARSDAERGFIERVKGSERVASFGLFPADGASALRGEQIIVVALDDAARGQLPEVSVRGVDPDSGEQTRWDAECALSSDGAVATCELSEELPYYQDFDLDVRSGDLALVHGLSSHEPERGAAWALHEDVTVERFGAGDALGGIIEDSFTADEGALVLADWNGEAGPTQLTSGRTDELGDGLIRIDSPGLTMAMDVEVTPDGGLHGEPADMFMPVRQGDETAFLIIYDAVLNGEITEDGLRWTLEGAVDLASVVRVTALYGFSEQATLSVVRADVDRDENGIDDALTFRAVGLAPPRELVTWTR